jgi:hypothetical protein
VQGPGTEVEPAGIGDVGGDRPRAGWPLLVGAARQASKSLVLEDLVDGGGAESDLLLLEGAADVVDGEGN